MKLDDAIRSSTSRAGVVRVRNALNPLLWLCGLVTPSSWVAVYFLHDDPGLEIAFGMIGGLPVAAALVAYFLLLFRDPNRLRSEEYQIRHEALQILHKRGESGDVVDVAVDSSRLKIEETSQEEP